MGPSQRQSSLRQQLIPGPFSPLPSTLCPDATLTVGQEYQSLLAPSSRALGPG